MTDGYAEKAATWCLYGKTKMSSLSTQLLLHLNIANQSQLHNGEGNCQAFCSVANILMEQVCWRYGTFMLT
jgi:hypothetical protein